MPITTNKSFKSDHFRKNIKKVYHTIDYDNGRNKIGTLKKKKSVSGNNSSESLSNSLTLRNKFIVSNDFVFNASQYNRNNKNFDTVLSIKEALNQKRKPANSGIISGLSNMKRRKKQQEFMSQDHSIFGNSLRNSNDGLPDNNAFKGRDHLKTKYNSFKNSPLTGTGKGSNKIVDISLGTIYGKPGTGIANFWQNSALNNSSFNGIKKNRSRDGIIQPNLKQNFQLKVKKKSFGGNKKSIREDRREINMPSINSQNRKKPFDQFNIQAHAIANK